MSKKWSSSDVLAHRLDQALPADKKFIPPTTPDPLVNAATDIAKLNPPTLSQQASERIAAQMMAAFDEVYHPISTLPAPRVLPKPAHRRWPSAVLRYGLVASLILIILVMGITPAVYASVPGEPLYTVKQLYENVELATAPTMRARTEIYLRHAQHRADEAVTLLARGQFDSALVTAALRNIDAAASSTDSIQASVRLRSQMLEVTTSLDFVMTNAQASGLTTAADIAALKHRVDGDTLIALPPPENPPAAAITETPEATETSEAEPTEAPSPASDSAQTTTDCASAGRSCQSQGVPGGGVIPGTPQGQATYRPPTHTPGDNNAGGNSNNGSNGNSGGGQGSSGSPGGKK